MLIDRLDHPDVQTTPEPVRAQKAGPIRDELTNHEYDGISEYDNPTPGWWHMLFFASVVFSVLYFTYYTFNPDAPTAQDSWMSMQTLEYKKIFGALGDLKNDDATLLKLMSDSKMMQVGAGIFVGNCAACHARDGGGINGVNLTDNSYKNVKALGDIYRVINDGAGSGAMPAWRNKLSENERVLMAAFVASLRGTTPAAPKGADGEPIPPWPKP